MNKNKNPSKKNNLEKELSNIDIFYESKIIDLVKNNTDQFLTEYINWNEALLDIAKKLGVFTSIYPNIPKLLEQKTFGILREKISKEKKGKIFLGIAGPGAVGKETIKNNLGFDLIINTTTRKKRDYEIQGKHYNFISNAEFKKIKDNGGFIVNMNRVGRGQYGIQKREVEKILKKSKKGIIEENPTNLTKLGKFIKTRKEHRFILVYVLPPHPIFLHLAARLASRCVKSGEDFKSVIKSTLGPRQLKEFNSVLGSIDDDIDVVFLVNDKVDRATKKLKSLIS